jgi:hypothetical protein
VRSTNPTLLDLLPKNADDIHFQPIKEPLELHKGPGGIGAHQDAFRMFAEKSG